MGRGLRGEGCECDNPVNVVASDLALSSDDEELGPGQPDPDLQQVVMKISSRERPMGKFRVYEEIKEGTKSKRKSDSKCLKTPCSFYKNANNDLLSIKRDKENTNGEVVEQRVPGEGIVNVRHRSTEPQLRQEIPADDRVNTNTKNKKVEAICNRISRKIDYGNRNKTSGIVLYKVIVAWTYLLILGLINSLFTFERWESLHTTRKLLHPTVYCWERLS